MKTIYLACAYSIKTPLAKVPTNPPGKWDFIGRIVMAWRCRKVTKVAAKLMARGHNVFSPITHSHHIARVGKLPHLSHDFWLRMDKWYVSRVDEVVVFNGRGYKTSTGVRREVEWALSDNIPVYLCDSQGNYLAQILSLGDL